MKIRIRFEKEGPMRYIGHLDILRYFQKAFQRSRICVKYSEGFHPHPIMSFASPLSVGLTSRGEYLDTEVTETAPSREMIRRLNDVMSEGMKVTQFRQLPDSPRRNSSAMALVGQALYSVRITGGSLSFPESAPEEFLAQREILSVKKGKKKKKEAEEEDIRPGILSFRYDGDTERYEMRLSAGSALNLKPETVMEAWVKYLGREDLIREVRDTWISICRLDLLTSDGISLGDLGEDIAEC